MQRPAFSQSPNRVGSGPSRPPISRGRTGGCGVAWDRAPTLGGAAGGSFWWAVCSSCEGFMFSPRSCQMLPMFSTRRLGYGPAFQAEIEPGWNDE